MSQTFTPQQAHKNVSKTNFLWKPISIHPDKWTNYISRRF